MAKGKPHGEKTRYSSQGRAIAASLRLGRKYDTTYRIYRCPDCQGFHLTRKGTSHRGR